MELHDIPINLPPEADYWDYLGPMFQSWDTPKPLAFEAQLKRHAAYANHGVLIKCLAPTLGFIRITLHLRSC